MKPILFNTKMVRAILDGRKTVTRRVVNPQRDEDMSGNLHEFSAVDGKNLFVWADRPNIKTLIKLPYQIDDILYVRETWTYGYIETTDFEGRCNECWVEEFPAGSKSGLFTLNRYFYRTEDLDGVDVRWRPSIHMPKEAARLFLRVKNVRVERLQDITDEQAIAEGVPDNCDYPLDNPVYCPVCKGEGLIGAAHPVSLGYMEVDCPHCDTPRKRFANLWNNTIKPANRDRYGWDANPWVWAIEFERCEKPKEGQK